MCLSVAKQGQKESRLSLKAEAILAKVCLAIRLVRAYEKIFLVFPNLDTKFSH